jgi:hypothetical protein
MNKLQMTDIQVQSDDNSSYGPVCQVSLYILSMVHVYRPMLNYVLLWQPYWIHMKNINFVKDHPMKH